jgi:DNA-binding transcriptional regulator YdaS (Cro superfamily)
MLAAMSASQIPAFQRACRWIGSYGAVGMLFEPRISAQAVAKWGEAGVPSERVLKVSEATAFRVTPHELRPDIYPNPTDGLPPEKGVFGLLAQFADVLTEGERDAVSNALLANPGTAVVAIEALDQDIAIRAQLLEAARAFSRQAEAA